jgi:hypothetical protein
MRSREKLFMSVFERGNMSGPMRLTLIVLIIASQTIASSTNPLKGVITDSEGAIIREARVFIHWDQSGADVGLKSNVGLKQDLVLQTNEKGEFRADLPPGFYDVFVTANGFSPGCRKLRIRVRESATFNIKLRADPLITNELGDRFPH